MYSWLLRPDTIPRSYSVWVSTAAKVLQPTVLVNRGFARNGRADPKDMQTLIDWKVCHMDMAPLLGSMLITSPSKRLLTIVP